MDSLPRIPTPAAQRWSEFRIQIVPVLVFIGVLAMIVMMWKDLVVPGVTGEEQVVKAKAIQAPDRAFAETDQLPSDRNEPGIPKEGPARDFAGPTE